MNWLGAGLPSFFAALFGTIGGALIHGFLLRHGIDFPPVITLIASVCALLLSREASALRGILVASLSCWAGALVDVLIRPDRGMITDLVHFNDRLSLLRFLLYVGSAVLGVVVASHARPRATNRAPDRRSPA